MIRVQMGNAVTKGGGVGSLNEVPLCPNYAQQCIPHLPSPEQQKMPLARAVKQNHVFVTAI